MGLLEELPVTPAALCLTQPQSLLIFTVKGFETSLPDIGTLIWQAWCDTGPLTT